jgi:hypothetical protein
VRSFTRQPGNALDLCSHRSGGCGHYLLQAAGRGAWVSGGLTVLAFDSRAYRAARSMNVIGGHVPAWASPVTSKP